MTLLVLKEKRCSQCGQWLRQTTRAVVASLLVIVFSSSCQHTDLSHQSPWTLAEFMIGQTLSSKEFDLGQVENRLSPRAFKQLKQLQQNRLFDESLGLISIRKNRVGGWSGFFAYHRHQWPLLLQFELESEKIGSTHFWRITNLPFFSAYQKLAKLANHVKEPKVDGDQLPWIQGAPSWEGGLTGKDVRGRPLSSVVVVWMPPLAFVDGIPLSGIANRAQLSHSVSQAFEQRRHLAEISQASYTPHVSLAFPRITSAIHVSELMAWMEGVGAEQISILVQSENGPGLIYLNPRTERTILVSPQRLLHTRLEHHKGHVHVQRTDQLKPEPFKGIIDLNPQETETLSKLDRATRSFYTFTDQVRSRGSLHGLVIHVDEQSTVSDLVKMIDVCQRVDPELAITLAPRSVTLDKKP